VSHAGHTLVAYMSFYAVCAEEDLQQKLRMGVL
jgi:hypothetical protein